MKKRFTAIILVAAVSVGLTACGNKGNEETVTESEIIETEQENQIANEETEEKEIENVVENEIEEIESTESPVEDTKEIAPVSHDDFNIENNGFSNYIDEYTARGAEEFAIVICDRQSTDNSLDNVYDQTSYRGIALGDSKERLLELYGEPHKVVDYWKEGWNHDGLTGRTNYNYSFIDERYPEVFFNLSFNLDQNDNVLYIMYSVVSMKWYN